MAGFDVIRQTLSRLAQRLQIAENGVVDEGVRYKHGPPSGYITLDFRDALRDMEKIKPRVFHGRARASARTRSRIYQ